MSNYQYQHDGGCDCGAVQFVYHCRQPLAEISPRACQCLYCLPHAASYLSDTHAVLEVRVRDLRVLYAHRFATNTADFMHCAICNTPVFVRSEIDSKIYALVCAPALREFQQLQAGVAMDYDDEDLAGRLQRRSQRWIPELHIHCENEH